MRLRFGTSDYHAYIDTRSTLLDELDGWLGRDEAERVEVVADVKYFLDWRYRESVGALDKFAFVDVSEFLLEWCPRRIRGRPDAGINLCFAVGVYLDFMAATGRLVGGVDRAARLRRMADDLVPTVLAEMRDPTTTVGGSCSDGAVEPYRLPFLYVPPCATEVTSEAAAARLLSQLDALRNYVGPEGKSLTDKGHLQVADGRALVDMLDTGDVLDPEIGGRIFPTQSTAALRRLNFVLDSVIEAGAVQVRQHRVVRAQAWETLLPVERAEALFAAIRQLRPLQSLDVDLGWENSELAKLLEDGMVHWLIPLVVRDGGEVSYEVLLEYVQSVVNRKLGPAEDMLEEYTEEGMDHLLEVLAAAGVVRWTDRRKVSLLFGPSRWTGGTLALTATGRHILPDHLTNAGYALRRLDRMADWDGTDLIETMLLLDKDAGKGLVAIWRAECSAVERVQMLTEAIVTTPTAAGRLVGFLALDTFDVEVAEPFVRQLLDTPVSGHAALWLISRQRADAATLDSFVDTAVLVDALALRVNEPAVLCSFFTGPEPMQLLENIWRHPAPETPVVLNALGRYLPDPALAKAARKAAVRHRSWMANRRN